MVTNSQVRKDLTTWAWVCTGIAIMLFLVAGGSLIYGYVKASDCNMVSYFFGACFNPTDTFHLSGTLFIVGGMCCIPASILFFVASGK